MVTLDPTWINASAGAPAYDSTDLRRVDALLTQTNGVGVGAQSGIRPGGGYTTTLAGTAISVSAGLAYIYFAGQGMYRVAMLSTWSGTLAAAHASLPRIDLVYLRVWDNDVDSSGLRQGDVVYLQGTPSSTPVAPTPAGTQIYIPLATITVPQVGGGSASVSTTIRPVAVAPGGITPDPAAAGNYAGQYRDNGTGLERYTGSTWKALGPYTPLKADQAAEPGYGTTGSWVDFTSGQWAAITVTVPPSGMLWISVGAAVINTNTTSSTAWAAWRASGGFTEAASEANGVSASGSRTYATRRVLRTGLTPGASVTFTPQWQISSIGTGITRVSNGQLTVEPVAVP